jgi:hypothetical protein
LNPDRITIYAIVKVNDFYTGPCGGNQILSKGYPYDIQGFYNLSYFDFASNCGTPNLANEVFAGSLGDNYPQGTSAGVVADTVKIQKGSWYKVTYTYDGSVSKIYIDGKLKSTLSRTSTFTPNSFNLFIGKHENPSFPYYLNGVIDEIRIYKRALPAQAVAKLNNLEN